MVALIARASLSGARTEIGNMLADRLTCEVNTENRAVRLPLSVSWVVFPLDATKGMRAFRLQLDSFVAADSTAMGRV